MATKHVESRNPKNAILGPRSPTTDTKTSSGEYSHADFAYIETQARPVFLVHEAEHEGAIVVWKTLFVTITQAGL
jgi:hypothetical protein